MSNSLKYSIQGSRPQPYIVTFEGEGPDLKASCSCPAGKKGGMFCKHIASLLNGDISKVVAASDDITALASKSAGSPLLETAKIHIPSKPKMQPLANIYSIKDIIEIIDPLLTETGFWNQYSTGEDGAEFLRVYMRKMYKNGKPYQKPTVLITVSYEPFIYESVYDDETEDAHLEARKRILPYLVNSTNYGSLAVAAANFVEKLKSIIAEFQQARMDELAAIEEAKRNAPPPRERTPLLTPEELQRRNTARKAAMRAKPVTQEVLDAAQSIMDALAGELPHGCSLEGGDRAKYYSIELLPKRQWICRLHYKTKNKYIELPGEDMTKVDSFEKLDGFIAVMATEIAKAR